MSRFTPTTLPLAVKTLFELNHFEVIGPVKLHGAEIDLVAKPLSDPFGSAIYIEATIEYVDNDKYGKDVGKLAMVRATDPLCRCLIVSALGFSMPVLERAQQTRIDTLTYDQLFQRFERFDKYIELYSSGSDQGRELARLNDIYQEAYFDDSFGRDVATQFLTNWRDEPHAKRRWLVLVGDYGTGKTALTKVLQYRWLRDYKVNPSLPLPIRIELRDFVRQFDERGLLHHFLDRNQLGHLPLDFVFSLIRQGRVLLLLDGYDEMAQHLHAAERRACLQALAHLSADGARGLLTSRPNYFTEAEELQVYESLYRSLEYGALSLAGDAQALVDQERDVDALLERFLDQFERVLQDLTAEQTEALVERVLSSDAEGRSAVLAVLRRIRHTVGKDDTLSLSGKPVIITYLLDVVEGLKGGRVSDDTPLDEAAVFRLILDQLMLRDFKRSPVLHPSERRRFLAAAAVSLSKKETPTLSEHEFKALINTHFAARLRPYRGHERNAEVERLFADLRSSATFTRATTPSGDAGWRFSHNVLREYLLFETMTDDLRVGRLFTAPVPVSEPMRLFATSLGSDKIEALSAHLSSMWKSDAGEPARGRLLSLLWGAIVGLHASQGNGREAALAAICGSPPDIRDCELSHIDVSSEAAPCSIAGLTCAGAVLSTVSFRGATLIDADLSRASLENVSFENADIRGARFRESLLMDVVFVGTDVRGADFSGVSPGDISIVVEDPHRASQRQRLDKLYALAYLRYNGAITDPIPDKMVWQFDMKFEVIAKIVENLASQTLHQRRGLEQRGAAMRDVVLARDFTSYLESKGLICTPLGRKDLVETTPEGRAAFIDFAKQDTFPVVIGSFVFNRLPLRN